MTENEFEQVAIHCVDEIVSFKQQAMDMQEVLSDWNTRLHELNDECDREWQEVTDSHKSLIKTIKDEAFQQSEEIGKITHAIEHVTETLHRLLATATEQHAVLEEASSTFGTSLKDYLEKHQQRQTSQEEAHHKVTGTFEENTADIEQSIELLSERFSKFTSKVSETHEHADESLSHAHEQIDSHADNMHHEYEELAQHLDDTHESAKQKVTAHHETLQTACSETLQTLEEGITRGLNLLSEAAEAISGDFSDMKGNVTQFAASLNESAAEVDDNLETATHGMARSAETLAGLHGLLAKFQ
jgi:methyl-accepting chemotaxis protein